MTNQLLAELGMANKKLEEKDKEIEELNDLLHKANDEVVSYADECIRLNNIINLKTDFIEALLKTILTSSDCGLVDTLNIRYKIYEDKLKELKEGK